MAKKSNASFALNLLFIVVGMLALTAASVPLYRLFCAVTGYGGTTQTAANHAIQAIDREVTISFNTDIDPTLPWEFKPPAQPMHIHIGQQVLTHFTAHNRSDHVITGRAVYNVTPFSAGTYFVKLECFCFKEQTLKSGQTVEMPVLFYVDPAMANDPEMKNIKTITLSYTFFPVKK